MTNEQWLSAEQWVEAFAREIENRPPDEEEFTRLLKLAAVAAHSSERTAAPVACWIAGRAGIPLEQAIEIAENLTPPKN